MMLICFVAGQVSVRPSEGDGQPQLIHIFQDRCQEVRKFRLLNTFGYNKHFLYKHFFIV